MKKFIIIIRDCVFSLLKREKKDDLLLNTHYREKQIQKPENITAHIFQLVYNIFRSSKEKEMKTNKHFFFFVPFLRFNGKITEKEEEEED